MSDVRRWIAVAFDNPGGSTDAVLVESATEEEAARIGVLALQTEWDESKDCHETVEHVFVAPWDDRVAYSTTVAVERSPMQCCGGPAPAWVDTDGHWGGCPEAKQEPAA